MRREDGFTVIELLVALAIGVVVFTGAMAVMSTEFTQSNGTVERTDAMQRGRIVLDQVTRLLRSQSCGTGVSRVVSGSDNSITFYADLNDGAPATTGGPPQSRPVQHTIALDTAGRITDTTIPGTGSVASGYRFTGTATTRTLGEAVYADPGQPAAGATPAVAGTPFLTYWGYPTPLTKPYVPSASLGSPLTTSTVRRVAKIGVTFLAQPTRTRSTDHGTLLQDQVEVRAADPSQDNPNPYDCATTP